MSTRQIFTRSATIGVALASALALSACGGSADAGSEPTSERKIGFVNISTDTFGSCLQKGVEAAATEKGVKLITVNSNNDPTKELTNVEDVISRGADAILMQTVNVDALAGGISKAKAANVPLYLTAVLPRETADLLGGTAVDLAGIGRQAAGWIAKDAGGADVTVGLITGVPGAASDILAGGFKESGDVAVVAEQPGMYNRGKAQDVAENIIQANPDLNYMFVQNEEMAFGALTAIQASGKDIKIVTSNGTDEGLAAVKSGDFAATIADSAYTLGYEGLTNMVGLLDDPSGEKVVQTETVLITKDNLDKAPKYCG